MAENGVITRGRVVYIDPNQLSAEEGINIKNGDNIAWNQEELNISVDLQVIMPDRNNCGQNDVIEDYVLTNINGMNSFFSGSNIKDNEKFLTNSYTDVSYQEIRGNNAGNKESLGIQSIDISFDSHFFPIVKIKMIDVRGFSLMMPEQKAEIDRITNQTLYDNAERLSQKNSNFDKEAYLKAHRVEVCQNFFKALFRFPYPRFALSIKGFYGTRVTFMLAVNDFQSSFNSQTGNFEVEIEFIGYMYGLYSDLPFNLLLIAPYINKPEDKEYNTYWENNIQPNGTFYCSDGTTKLLTFAEFIEKYENLPANFSKVYNSQSEASQTHVSQANNLMVQRDSVESLLSEYKKLIENIGIKNRTAYEKGSKYMAFFTKDASIDMPYNDATAFETKLLDSGIGIELPDDFGTLKTPNVSVDNEVLFVGNKGTYKLNSNNTSIKLLREEGESQLISKIEKNTKIHNCKIYVYEIQNKFIQSLKDFITSSSSEIDTELLKAEDEIMTLTKNTLEFVPTIENVFRMLFAHLDTFMHEYYNVLDNIKNNDTRKDYNNYKIAIEKTDIETNSVISNGSCFLPPFAAFYEDLKHKERKYPGEISNLSSLEEVSLIDGIFKSVDSVNGKFYNNTSSNDNSEGDTIDGSSEDTDTTQTDTWKMTSCVDIYNTDNPYNEIVVKDNNADDFVAQLTDIVIKRLLVICNLHGKDNMYSSIPNELIDEEVNTLLLCQKENLSYINGVKDIIDKLSEDNNDKEIYKFCSRHTQFKKYDIEDTAIGIHKIDDFPLAKGITYKKNHGINLIFSKKTKKYNFGNKDFFKDKFLINAYEETRTGDKPYRIVEINGDKKSKVEYSNENVKKIRQRLTTSGFTNQYFVPILQVYEGDRNMENLCQMEAFIKNSGKINACRFLTTLVGTTDYNFESGHTTIVRLPYFVLLYYGAILWIKSESKIKKDYSKYYNTKVPFMIDKNGISILTVDKKSLQKIGDRKLDIESFLSENDNNVLKNEFITWAEGNESYQWKSIHTALINAYGNINDYYAIKGIDKTTEKFFRRYGTKYEEAQKKLMSFLCLQQDVINIRLTGEKLYYLKLRYFFKKLKAQINGEEQSNITDNTISSSNNSDSGYSGGGYSGGEESSESVTNSKQDLYYTLKNLYDKWICSYNRSRFELKTPNEDREISNKKSQGNALYKKQQISEYNNFIFIDSFYQDISNKFLVDPKTIYELIKAQQNGDKNRSILEFISDLAQSNKLLLIPLPVYNNLYNIDSIKDIFRPHQSYDLPREVGTTYALMYSYPPANKVSKSTFDDTKEENSVGYKDDTFLFSEDNLSITEMSGELFEEDTNSKNNYTVPVFRVAFGKQNQMYFKGLTLNMSNPRETEQAIANRFILAEQGSKGATNRPTTVGQNMFSIYSNRQYDCGVDMMGCANIMPLMYFQLDNVPMFSGAYIITNVKHHIENGIMTTNFTGTKMSINKIPFATSVLNIKNLLDIINSGELDGDNDNIEVGGSGDDTNTTVHNPGVTILGSGGMTANVWSGITKDTVYDVTKVEKAAKSSMRLRNTSGSKNFVLPNGPYNNRKYYGLCANATKQMFAKGFDMEYPPFSCNGYECGKLCYEKFNCKAIAVKSELDTPAKREEWTKKYAEPGDLGVMRLASYSPDHGTHTCVYIDGAWVSDCRQNGLSCYNSVENYDVAVYRYQGPRIMPDYYCKVDYGRTKLDNKDYIKLKVTDVFNNKVLQDNKGSEIMKDSYGFDLRNTDKHVEYKIEWQDRGWLEVLPEVKVITKKGDITSQVYKWNDSGNPQVGTIKISNQQLQAAGGYVKITIKR